MDTHTSWGNTPHKLTYDITSMAENRVRVIVNIKDMELGVLYFEQCDNSGAEYYYIMRDGTWYCGDTYESSPLSKKLTALADALQSQTVDQ